MKWTTYNVIPTGSEDDEDENDNPFAEDTRGFSVNATSAEEAAIIALSQLGWTVTEAEPSGDNDEEEN